jgi:hypothetical protein
MGPDILIPVFVLAVLVPVVAMWAKRRFKDDVGRDDRHDEVPVAPADRFTSNALRDLESPPWRVVYEIGDDKLGGIGHVVAGRTGVYGLRTTMDPFPAPATTEPDARAVSEAAVARADLDDALRRCSQSSDRLVTVHWGANEGSEIAVDIAPGHTAVDGRSLETWIAGTGPDVLSPAQVDLAWQSVVTAVGRPDPLDT